MSRRERIEKSERSERELLSLRAADDDRQAAVAELQRHFVAGRLTDAELGERIKRALDAETHGDLAALLADLPAAPTGTRPERQRRRHRHGYRWSEDWGYTPHVRAYLGVMVLLVFIWLMTTPGGYFWPMWPALGLWPMWPALGWGIGIFVHGSARKCGVRPDDASPSPDPRLQMM